MELHKIGNTGEYYELMLFEIHEWLGIISVAIIFAHIGNNLCTKDKANIKNLFPWTQSENIDKLTEWQLWPICLYI